jgi:ACS family glucarate transporter-like MFS transporter
VWLLASLLWFRRPAAAEVPTQREPTEREQTGFRTLVTSTSMWGLFLTQGAGVYSHYLFLTWLPSYLQTTRHLTILKTGLLSAIPFAATVILSIAIGMLSDRILRGRDRRTGHRRWMVAAMMLISSVVLLTPLVSSTWVILVLMTVSLTGISAATGLNNALLTDLLPSSANAGTANGVLVVGGNIFGMMAPVVTGYVIAGTGSYDGAWVISGALLLAGMIITLTMTRRPIGASVIGAPLSA